jgi:hypothetical protein
VLGRRHDVTASGRLSLSAINKNQVLLDNLANCGIMEVPTTLNIFRSPLSAGGLGFVLPPADSYYN